MSEFPKIQGPDGTWYVTCQEVITFLLAYIEGELEPEKQEEFERHLAVCPSCVTYLRQYKETVRLAKESVGPAGSTREELARLSKDLVAAILASR